MPRIEELIFVETQLPLLVFPSYLGVLLADQYSLDFFGFLLEFTVLFKVLLLELPDW